jgi:tetratricopeptide (TPR) repeat protein
MTRQRKTTEQKGELLVSSRQKSIYLAGLPLDLTEHMVYVYAQAALHFHLKKPPITPAIIQRLPTWEDVKTTRAIGQQMYKHINTKARKWGFSVLMSKPIHAGETQSKGSTTAFLLDPNVVKTVKFEPLQIDVELWLSNHSEQEAITPIEDFKIFAGFFKQIDQNYNIFLAQKAFEHGNFGEAEFLIIPALQLQARGDILMQQTDKIVKSQLTEENHLLALSILLWIAGRRGSKTQGDNRTELLEIALEEITNSPKRKRQNPKNSILDPRHEASVWIHKGRFQLIRRAEFNDDDIIKSTYQKARRYLTSEHSHLRELGSINAGFGELKFWYSALKAFLAVGWDWGVQSQYANIGIAIRVQAEKARRETNDEDLFQTLLRQAGNWLERADELSELAKLGGSWELSVHLGRTRRLQGRFDDAELELDKAVNNSKRDEYQLDLALALRERSHLYLEQKRYSLALQDATESARYYDASGDPVSAKLMIERIAEYRSQILKFGKIST